LVTDALAPHPEDRESPLRQLVRVRDGEVEIGNGAMGADLVGFVHIRHQPRDEHSPKQIGA
jgi:hypothetical protein